MNIRRKKAVLVIGAALASGIIVGGGVVAFAAGSDPDPGAVDDPGKLMAEAPRPTAPPAPGEDPKIGPWAAGAPAPDLTPVELEDGRTGYLRIFDLAKPPSELKQRQVDENTTETLITVYDKDGQTVIGEHVVGTTTVE